jgi:hypothetical protein
VLVDVNGRVANNKFERRLFVVVVVVKIAALAFNEDPTTPDPPSKRSMVIGLVELQRGLDVFRRLYFNRSC